MSRILLMLIAAGAAAAEPAVLDAKTFRALPDGAARRLGDGTFRHGSAYAVAFSRDGKTLYSADWDDVRVWDAATGELVRVLRVGLRGARQLAVAADGSLVVLSYAHHVAVLDPVTGKEHRRIAAEPGEEFHAMAVSADGKRVAVGGWGDGAVYDLATGARLAPRVAHVERSSGAAKPASVHYLAFSPDGKTLATGGFKDAVRLWDVESGTEVRSFADLGDTDGPLVFTPDGKALLFTLRDRDQRWVSVVTPLAGGREEPPVVAPGAAVWSVTPDGKTLVGSHRYRLGVFDAATGKLRFALGPPESRWLPLAISPDGKRVAWVSGGVQLADLETGRSLLTGTAHTGRIVALDVSADGKLAATGGDDTVRVWATATGKLARKLEPGAMARSVALAPDNAAVAALAGDEIRVWDLTTGRPARSWAVPPDSAPRQVAFSPDGRLIGLAGGSQTVWLYEAATGKLKSRHVGLDGSGNNSADFFAFVPGGKAFVAPVTSYPREPDDPLEPAPPRTSGFDPELGPGGNTDGKTGLALWDIASGKRLRLLGPLRKDGYPMVAFAPDGEAAAVSGATGIHIVEVKTGKELRHIDGLGWPLAYTPAGRLIVGDRVLEPDTGKVVSRVKFPPRTGHTLFAIGRSAPVAVAVIAGETTALVYGLKDE